MFHVLLCIRRVGPTPELVRHREAKWINIIVQWESILLKKTNKVCAIIDTCMLYRSYCKWIRCRKKNRMHKGCILFSRFRVEALQMSLITPVRFLLRETPVSIHTVLAVRSLCNHGNHGCVFRSKCSVRKASQPHSERSAGLCCAEQLTGWSNGSSCTRQENYHPQHGGMMTEQICASHYKGGSADISVLHYRKWRMWDLVIKVLK